MGKPGRGKAHYKFSVYIANHTLRSESALERLKRICKETIPGDYEIKVIDIAKHPTLAKDRQTVATPAVFRTLPASLRKSIGDLSIEDKALLGLDLFHPLKARPPRGKARRPRAKVSQAAD
jgi:circadian clock protein KaiB